MATYTTTKATLDEISKESEEARKMLDRAKVMINDADTRLASLQTTYSSFITQLNTDAAANPADPAWINAKAEKDQIVSDFQALKTRSAALKTAVIEP